MIKEKTVFIFGAGLSSDYYFPTGSRLRDQITDLLKFDNSSPNLPQQIKVLRSIGFNTNQVIEFREQLEDGGFDTIDEFLEARKNETMRSLGKVAIAMALIRHENPSLLSKNRASDDCFYRFLFKRMAQNTTKETFTDNLVSFVTFNYDRSFEFFLWRALCNYYEGIQEQEANNIMNKLKVIHVHGKLGDLPWQNPTSRHYIPMIDQLNLGLAANGIVNFNDVDGSYSGYKEARNEIREAKNINFIGFGFHTLNLSRIIEENCLDGNKTILTTALGIDSRRIKEIDKLTDGKLNSGNMKQVNSVQFAKEYLIGL